MATIFDDGMVNLTRTQCLDMVLHHWYDSRTKTPAPFLEALGKTFAMQVQYARSTTSNSSLLSVNRMFTAPAIPLTTPPPTNSPSNPADNTTANNRGKATLPRQKPKPVGDNTTGHKKTPLPTRKIKWNQEGTTRKLKEEVKEF